MLATSVVVNFNVEYDSTEAYETFFRTRNLETTKYIKPCTGNYILMS